MAGPQTLVYLAVHTPTQTDIQLRGSVHLTNMQVFQGYVEYVEEDELLNKC